MKQPGRSDIALIYTRITIPTRLPCRIVTRLVITASRGHLARLALSNFAKKLWESSRQLPTYAPRVKLPALISGVRDLNLLTGSTANYRLRENFYRRNRMVLILILDSGTLRFLCDINKVNVKEVDFSWRAENLEVTIFKTKLRSHYVLRALKILLDTIHIFI